MLSSGPPRPAAPPPPGRIIRPATATPAVRTLTPRSRVVPEDMRHAIVISSAAEVRRRGQLCFARLARAPGAESVGVRDDLPADAASPQQQFARAASDAAMQAVHANPDDLCDAAPVRRAEVERLLALAAGACGDSA